MEGVFWHENLFLELHAEGERLLGNPKDVKL